MLPHVNNDFLLIAKHFQGSTAAGLRDNAPPITELVLGAASYRSLGQGPTETLSNQAKRPQVLAECSFDTTKHGSSKACSLEM